MTVEEFEKLKQKFLDEMSAKLSFKRGEYANDFDVFRNFKRGKEVSGKSPFEVLRMYSLKHEISLDDLFNMLAEGKPVSKELFLEKATDFANYLLLAFAMMFEEESS